MLQVHYNYWNLIHEEHIASVLSEKFRGVTATPNYSIIHRIKMLGEATIQCWENRTTSTVYKILPTNELVQVFKSKDKEIIIFENIEIYSQAMQADTLMAVA
jgi:hypothetical protein